MKRIKLSALAVGLCVALLTGIVTGCGEKDLYDPNYGKNELPPLEDYFGFDMRSAVELSVNYCVPNYKALIEVYDENPLAEDGKVKKADMRPIYTSFVETDKTGAFKVKMYVPTSVKELYLYTDKLGLPSCVKLEAVAGGFSYNAAKRVETRATKVKNAWTGDKVPYQVIRSDGRVRQDNLYSLTEWDFGGDIRQTVTGADYVQTVGMVGDETFSVFTDRLKASLNASNSLPGGNAALVQGDGKLNLVVSKPQTEVSVTFVGDYAAYTNTFGYYYYPTGTTTIDLNAFKAIKKYIIFPNASNFSIDGGVVCGSTAKLLYFDEQTGEAQTHFPAGYTIGWFMISNGYLLNSVPYDNIREMNFSGYPSVRNMCFSNEKNAEQQFMSLYDEKSKTYIIGIEDQLSGEKDDFMDVLFYVSTNVDMDQGDLPSIPEEKPQPETGVETIRGTFCFEDGWPTGKDYDLNDVVVQYERVITFDDKNYAKDVKETFKYLQKEDAANLNSYFAYQVENLGTVSVKPDDSECVIENATKSVVFKNSAKVNRGKEFVVERTFEPGTVSKETLKTDFNPYIIVDVLRENNRIEVHLPKHLATSAADPRLISTKDDIYYTDKGGKFPFAIDIPVWGFELSPERVSISETYKNFDAWVSSGGTEYTDWYKK